jgi:hypothetical protein
VEENLRSLYFELYDLTVTIADRFRITPFEMFAQDCDEVISLINYFLEKSETEGKKPKQQPPTVNDGFWDF